ncbi:MAG: NRDE family protein [Polaromonas sp.]|nr:NRDE family protein [Polaromonas sp.]
MCLLAIAMGVSDRWPLVIASNRDEYRDRPTLPLAVWSTPGEVTVVSGRDLLAGGTWMGSTTGGRIALLTNVREPDATAAALSRGDLPLRWLEGQMNAAQFLADTNPTSYGGCNLLMGDFLRGEWTWASNRANVGAVPLNSQQTTSGWQTMALSPGIYGLSNALLDTPWPKTQALKAAMAGALAKADADGDTAVLANILWPALGNTERAALHDLPTTGVATALEQALSSALIDMPERGYGTRCSTLMWIAAEPNSNSFSATICEKSMTAESPKPSASDAQMVRLTWSMPV